MVLDIGGVISRIGSEDAAVDFFLRLQSVETTKFFILSRIFHEGNASASYSWSKPWCFLFTRANGVIFNLGREDAEEETVRFWRAQNSEDEDVRKRWHLGQPNVIYSSGSKGQTLGVFGVPVFMIDNRLEVLGSVMRHCPPGSYCIYRPPENEATYRERHLRGGTRDSAWRRPNGELVFRSVERERG